MQKVTLDHLNLTVRNFSESVEWYQRVFGFSLVEKGMDEDGPWGIIRSGDTMLCIYESSKRTLQEEEESERYHRIYHFGLRVHDRGKWEKTLIQERPQIYYSSPVRYPHSFSWYIQDPTGHRIEVSLWDNDQVRFFGETAVY